MNEQIAFSMLTRQIPNMLVTKKISKDNWLQVLLILEKVRSSQNTPSEHLQCAEASSGVEFLPNVNTLQQCAFLDLWSNTCACNGILLCDYHWLTPAFFSRRTSSYNNT